MKVLVAIAPERYRDEELDEPLAVFTGKGLEYEISSVRRGTCRGMLGGKVTATMGFDEADPASYDGIVIIGGAGSPAYLWGSRELADLVQAFHAARKVIAAICLSPVVLARAGILKGRNATLFRSADAISEMIKGGAILANTAVVEDGLVITADGPAAARAFGEAVVAALNR
jgi:protease I